MAPLKTYIVEDSPVIRDSLIATLEELGPVQVVGWAAAEDVALRWLERADNEAALVIVDLFLASGSGLALLRAAAMVPSLRRWVVLSNYVTPALRRHCLDLGAERVFDKSADIEALLAYCGELAAAAAPAAARAH
jgi:DNA-binding NarL/FixJ family response regulator